MSAFEKDYRVQETEHTKLQKEKQEVITEEEKQEKQKEMEHLLLKGKYSEEKNNELEKLVN